MGEYFNPHGKLEIVAQRTGEYGNSDFLVGKRKIGHLIGLWVAELHLQNGPKRTDGRGNRDFMKIFFVLIGVEFMIKNRIKVLGILLFSCLFYALAENISLSQLIKEQGAAEPVYKALAEQRGFSIHTLEFAYHLQGTWQACAEFSSETYKIIKNIDFDRIVIEYFKSSDDQCNEVSVERFAIYDYIYKFIEPKARTDGSWEIIMIGYHSIPLNTPVAFFELLAIVNGKLYSSNQEFVEDRSVLTGLSKIGFEKVSNDPVTNQLENKRGIL